MENNKSILELSEKEVQEFFLKEESYCNIPLPQYFSFNQLLLALINKAGRKNLRSLLSIKNAKQEYGVNYTLFGNKDGKLSYRPLQLIHPLIYVCLVNEITKKENWEKLKGRFENNFQINPKIKCCSIPVQSNTEKSNQAEQIMNWWGGIEQASIELALEYSYMFETDIADCYGSIYTHSIAWAVDTKETTKVNRGLELLGNSIDDYIQSMQGGQTNGIPQGSVLMDFIAEIVLGYIDELLTIELKKQNIENYQILRYRDDYKIFVNNPNDGHNILKILSQILVPFGLKLNTSKTKANKDIITNSIKEDKLEWLKLLGSQELLKTNQKKLLVIYQHSIEYPNCGSLIRALSDFSKNLENENSIQIISITVNIMLNNPKTIPVCSAIISQVLKGITEEERKKILGKIYEKVNDMANSDIAKIWLQRIVKSNISDYEFDEKLCKIAKKESGIELWNNNWINGENDFKKLIEKNTIFNQEIFDRLDEIIKEDEYNIFYSNYSI